MRDALERLYQRDERELDAAAWLRDEGDEEGKRQAGVAGVTVEALREVGLLAEIVPTKEGLVVWRGEFDKN